MQIAPGGNDPQALSPFRSKELTARWQNSNQIYLEACERVRAKKSVENLEERQAATEAEVERYRSLIAEPCCLIHPEAKYMQYWDLCTMLALVYTATVTPFEVAFWLSLKCPNNNQQIVLPAAERNPVLPYRGHFC